MRPHVALFILTTLCSACSNPDTGEDPRERVLHAWWDQFLGPELDELGAETSALSERIGEFCATLSDPSLDAAQSQWAKAHRRIKRQEIFNFGPYVEEPLRYKVKLDFWPARPTTIEATIANEDLDLAKVPTLPGPSRGLPVIEYLLWETDTWTPRRCDYLIAVAEDAHAQSVALKDAWDPALGGAYGELLNPGPNGTYKTLVLSVSAVINRLWFTVENIHLMKLGKPLFTAADGGTAQPELVEAQYSGRSIEAIHDNLDAVEHLYFGEDGNDEAVGIAQFVPATQQSLNDDIRAEFVAVRAALDAIDVPLDEAVVAQPNRVADAIEALERLQRLIEVDAISALGLSLSFNDNDGD